MHGPKDPLEFTTVCTKSLDSLRDSNDGYIGLIANYIVIKECQRQFRVSRTIHFATVDSRFTGTKSQYAYLWVCATVCAVFGGEPNG